MINNLTLKQFFKFIILLFVISCTPSNKLNEQEIDEIKMVFGVMQESSPIEGDHIFFKNISYGSRERNRLDVLLPNVDQLNGAVLFFHGGAFLFGTKEDLYEGEQKEILTTILKEKIAVVNAEYTFINDAEAKGVVTSLEDGSKVIDFITERAALLNLPQNKIILAGISAGAGIAQWNGFREQSNSQVKGIFATIAQSTYDLYQWEELFPDFSLDSLRKTSTDLEDLLIKFYDGEPSLEKSESNDYRNQMDSNDPPLYIYNPIYEDVVVKSDNEIDFNVLFHSYKHADFIRKKATEVDLEFSGAYQETPIDFIKRMLSGK